MQHREQNIKSKRVRKQRTTDRDYEKSKHFERKMQVLTSKSKLNKYKKYDEEDI